ncbi:uncharacterized protein C8R40DRAFT_1241123 [Lentinula edodes]|uniref:uncharacterized protein n=1 Tax=Lentinula edodes TaxID=5353 RepID=UPI001E8DB1EC|nr:uncharacterized protein C8R40DRAFT_1241123 [Lentinula edodes]KAH7869316.1 hypothetical protein C8R40DRAFT_1241123 [Lentinula edodes]
MSDSEAEIASMLDPTDVRDPDENSQDMPAAGSSTQIPRNGNNNWRGTNQYKHRPPIGDETVHQALLDYHRRNITDKRTISELLKSDYGITLSASSVTRHKSHWRIKASRVTTATMPEIDKRQAVFDEMAKDPNGQRGPRIIKERIALDQGIHLTRLYVENTMRAQDPEGFQSREPASKKISRSVLICIGPHQEWSGDGHDKLAGIGFPIWGVRDVWSGKWLGLWVVPNNRLKDSIAYLFLKLVHEYGGIPVQMTTDCGSELVSVYGFANALREAFVSDLPIEELAAHRFLQSIHNITIERGWLRLRLEWGENVKIFWDAGSTVYNSEDSKHYDLARWLWSTLIQTELDHLRDAFNNHRVRKDRGKALPSGLAPNVSFSLYEKYGGENGLLPVDCTIVKQLMENIGGEDLIRFVSRDYAAKAQAVFVDQLGNPKLTMTNVWDIFQEMLPCI